MRLSHIKLAGFKSFVDPTHIHLPGQIVGVVGPNGCGKSNVIDALRWVLGESKASALRGESMQDVIFNGSGRRKAVSRASVELVFDNSEGRAAGQWSSYAEISIGRVLQRNGDSSYLINNQKVRRRDITDIFLGTGLGARAYAIIEQGMISRIIEARPEELRVFLEEAAGVSKYRDRRRETAQRLGDTQANLSRVGDILLEMETQLERLEQQALTARRYREFESARTHAQHLLWQVKRQDAESMRASHAKQLESTRTQLEATTASLRETESRLEMARSSHYRLSDELHERQGALYSANAQISVLEEQIRQIQTQRLRLEQQISAAKLQHAQQNELRDQAASQLEEWLHKQEEAACRLEDAQMVAQGRGELLPQVEEAARAAQQALGSAQRDAMQLQQQLQLNDAQHNHLQRNLAQMDARLARLQQELQDLPKPDIEAQRLAEEESYMLDMEHEQLQQELATLQEQLPCADSLVRDCRSRLQSCERSHAQAEAKLVALQRLQEQIDGDRNLQGWLQAHGLDKSPRLWQSIRIEAGWESALEAVLRERLNAHAVTELAAFDDVPPGRVALFEPVDEDADSPVQQELSPLSSRIEYLDLRVRKAACAWLSSVYAVEDVKTGLALRFRLPAGACFATPEGHLIGAHSIQYHAPDGQLHGVMARQREIETLQHELTEFSLQAEDARHLLDEAEQGHRHVSERIPPLRNRLHDMQQRRHALQMQILRLNQIKERSAEREGQIAREIAELHASVDTERLAMHEKSELMAALREEMALCRLQVEEAAHRADEFDSKLRSEREAVRAAQHALQEAQYFSRTCADKIADVRTNISRIEQALSYSEQSLEDLQAELMAGEDDTVSRSLQAALQSRHDAEAALSDARMNLETAAAGLQALEQSRMSCEHELGGLRERLSVLTLKEQEARLHAEQWAELLDGVDVVALQPHLGGAKPAQLQSELNRLDREIEALGAVNLAALEELKAATERKRYLEAQSEDLSLAIETLEEAIRRIDGESRDLLMDTYNKVNLQLAELFPVLFAGGEARLVLSGEEILDSGVQVMAQPPGKKNSTIHLLSGGEKALTAIALIFSLFRLNPAPFCLLDEVDAPLDDTNTERLCKLIQRMAQHTQFVFISHNKIAMEMAQQLIGVTMQEKGVSKVVSVDIEAALQMRDEALS